jgi:BlaI family transcriptional regulator, penicillinase repressor
MSDGDGSNGRGTDAANGRPGAGLSRRERQIMDALYRLGPATVAEVRAAMPDAPGYSAVRAMLRILEDKGHLRHRERAGKYVYAPRRSRADAARQAVRRLLGTFFEGSAARAMAAMLDEADARLSDEELDRLAQQIEAARAKGKSP